MEPKKHRFQSSLHLLQRPSHFDPVPYPSHFQLPQLLPQEGQFLPANAPDSRRANFVIQVAEMVEELMLGVKIVKN